jgi:hypothetical protein
VGGSVVVFFQITVRFATYGAEDALEGKLEPRVDVADEVDYREPALP